MSMRKYAVECPFLPSFFISEFYSFLPFVSSYTFIPLGVFLINKKTMVSLAYMIDSYIDPIRLLLIDSY